MAAKKLVFDQEARNKIASGLNAIANVVKVTLGPRGRNVALEKPWGAPLVTKDGVTVAKEIELEDRFAGLGVQMVKLVAATTASAAGDGTTTATVLAQALYMEGAKVVAAGANPMDVKRGIDTAVKTVVAELSRQSKRTKDRNDMAEVATISANGDIAIGNLIADAMEKVGKEGVVTVEEAKSTETTLEFTAGMRFDRGFLSPHFVTDADSMKVVLTDAYVLIHEKQLSKMRDLLPLLEKVAGSGKPLLIIAETVGGDALATLVVNNMRGTIDVCPVKAPGFGDRRRQTLEDIAILTGGRALTSDLGLDLQNITLEDLGRARSIVVDKDTTTIIEGAGTADAIEARIRQLRAQIETETSTYDLEKLQERLAKLAGGVAVINVGAPSEIELNEKKARVDDALRATRAAQEEGVVPGGGVALLRALPALAELELPGDQQFGVNIVARAIEEPLRQIARNAGADSSVVVNEVRGGKRAFGYNAMTGAFEDLLAAGVVDATKVVRLALENAASVAGLMLTTEVLIVGQT